MPVSEALPFHATDIHSWAGAKNTECGLIDASLSLTMCDNEKGDGCKMNIVVRADWEIRVVPIGFLLTYVTANDI